MAGLNPQLIQQLLSMSGGPDANAHGPALPMSGMSYAPTSKIQQLFDPKGPQGIMARGSNVYAGGLPGPPGAGRPRKPTPVHNSDMQAAAQRRLGSGPTR